MHKNPEQTAATREALMRAFFALYSEKPVERIGVKEIVALAGYNRSTFYEYFASTYDLLDQAESELIAHIREVHGTGTSYQLDDITALCDLFDKNKETVSALLGPFGQIRFLEKVKDELKNRFQPLAEGFDEKLAPYMIEYCAATSLAIFNLWQSRSAEMEPAELFAMIEGLHRHGLDSFLHDTNSGTNCPERSVLHCS